MVQASVSQCCQFNNTRFVIRIAEWFSRRLGLEAEHWARDRETDKPGDKIVGNLISSCHWTITIMLFEVRDLRVSLSFKFDFE